jgi:hypothetical protein
MTHEFATLTEACLVDDTTYVASAEAGTGDLYTVQPLISPPANVFAVSVVAFAEKKD